MKPAMRWTIVVLVVVVIAILLWLWNQRGEKAPPESAVVQQPVAPTPPPAPPKVVEPIRESVLFDYDRSVIRAGEAPKLADLSAKFKDGTFDRIDAVGHTDRIGSSTYNMQLSQRRADAVQAYLAGRGVDAAKVHTEARGKGEPVTGESCKNMGAEKRRNKKLVDCLQPDRRVEITLVPKP